MDVAELVRYNHLVRRVYLEALTGLPWSEVVKPRGASFDSMRNIFLHLTFEEERLVNYVISGMFREEVERSFDEFGDIDALKKLGKEVEARTDAYLRNLTPDELSRMVILPWRRKPPMKVSVETVLMQLVTEDLYHYGELIALLWQMGVKAPYFGWWRYSLGLGLRD